MNKRQREVELYKLDQESAVLKQLERQYRLALEDVQLTIRLLQADEQTQSKIHRINYQKKLEKQLEGALEKLHMSEYKSISKYLNDSYNTGFVGTMYDLHGQGVPIIAPIDQNAAVKAIQLDTKLSDRKIHESLNGELVTLYESLGVDVDDLKKTIRKEITRGIASGMMFDDIARNISYVSKAPLSRAKTIVRTEGHRIQQQSADDARQTAKAKGADVVKQWDSTMDGATRPNHRTLDGKIVEVNERFKIGKFEPRFPGDFGDPAEDCNCRCVALTRARKALDAAELKTLKERAAYFKLDKSEDFADFEKKYLKAAGNAAEREIFTPAKTIAEAEKFAKQHGVKYADYSKLPLATANEVNRALTTLPDDAKPVFVGASNTLEQYWGGKLPRSSKQYYGVTVDTYSGIHLGPGKGYDFDTNGYMVGISSSYKTSDKITAAKKDAQERYEKMYGRKWFFNETGETTPAHEMGHVYANIKGLPDGFESAAIRWANESGCDILKKPSEAWAEAWAAYHTNTNELPDYISKYIAAASGQNAPAKARKSLIFFDDDGIISKKKADFKQAFEAGKIRTIISPQKQSRHIKNSKEFAAYSAKLAARGDYPSYIREDLSNNDLKNLVVSKLKGNVQVTNGKGYREFVTCDEVVGYYYSKPQGKYVATKCAQINYATGDGNIHIIPVKELPEGGGVRESQD